MSLFFDLRVTTSPTSSKVIGSVEINRREDLDLSDKGALEDVVSTYAVRVDGREVAEVRHRYGDGAWALARAALVAAFPPGPAQHDHGGRGQRAGIRTAGGSPATRRPRRG